MLNRARLNLRSAIEAVGKALTDDVILLDELSDVTFEAGQGTTTKFLETQLNLELRIGRGLRKAEQVLSTRQEWSDRTEKEFLRITGAKK